MEGESAIKFEDKFLTLEHQAILRYWEKGNKANPKIVFLHGIGSGIESWLAQFEFLSKYFYVIAIDIPGFGKSRIGNNNYDLRSLLNILDLFVASKGLERFSFLGHSLGGFLSLEYANVHPYKIDKLVLIASGGFGMPSKRFRFLASRFSQLLVLPFVKTNFFGPKIFKYFYGNGLPVPAYEKLSQHWNDPMVIKTFVKVLGQSDQQKSANISSISSPCLIIWGKKDWVLDYHLGIIAKSKLPRSTLKLFGGIGHGVHTEIPERINPLILEFLAP